MELRQKISLATVSDPISNKNGMETNVYSIPKAHIGSKLQVFPSLGEGWNLEERFDPA